MRIYLLSILILSFTFGCKTIAEVQRLSNCDFEFYAVDQILLHGIDIQGKTSLGDIKFDELATITKGYLNESLPLSFIAKIKVYNPNDKVAALNHLDWKMLVDEMNIAQGAIERRFEVEPHDSTIMPIFIEIDLLDLLKNENKKTIINFAFNLVDAGGYPTKLNFKAKPTVVVGDKEFTSPGFISIKKRIGN